MATKVLVTVELTNNNYSAYIESLPGCVSTGRTFDELKENMQEAVDFHLEGMKEDGEDLFPNGYELVYNFDAESLLSHYNGIFTNAALERITGINQKQLQHYSSGRSKPRKEQRKKIEDALHRLGNELSSIKL